MMKKWALGTASLVLLGNAILPGVWVGAEEANAPLTEVTDGLYQGEGEGYGGTIKVEVTLQDQKIEEVQVLEHNESKEVFDRALPIFLDRVMEEQTPDVDLVTAATFSTRGLKQALAQALEEAGASFDDLELQVAMEDQKETQEAESSQIVIIGGGPAGLSAAISAKEAGVDDIILVEKLDILSGNGKFDRNFFDMYQSVAMEEAGESMTKEEFLESKEGAMDSPERLEVWAEGAGELDDWLRGHGIELNYNFGGTSHMAEEGVYAGDHIQTRLEELMDDLGIDVRTGTQAVDLLFEDGQAQGILVEDRDSQYEIHAPNVIIATGGFSANEELVQEYLPDLSDFMTSNQLGATGDLMDVYAEHDIQVGSLDVPSVFKMILLPRRDLTGGADTPILLNAKGERFVDETGSGLEVGQAILDQEDSQAFFIFDESAIERDLSNRLGSQADKGYFQRYESLEELAEDQGMDPALVRETLEAYNQAVQGEAEDSFIKENMPETAIDLDQPLYIAQVQSALHMTKGGVVCDEKAQVLNTDQEVIPGLFAAGEATETAGAYSAAVVWGRVAGQSAAQNQDE